MAWFSGANTHVMTFQPVVLSPTPRSMQNHCMQAPIVHPTSLLAYSDSDWGSDASHRRLVTVAIILLAGADAKYQKAIALSRTRICERV